MATWEIGQTMTLTFKIVTVLDIDGCDRHAQCCISSMPDEMKPQKLMLLQFYTQSASDDAAVHEELIFGGLTFK